MSAKSNCFILALLVSAGTFAQPRVFLYEEIHARNKKQQWENTREIYTRAAHFYLDSIEVMADKFYDLTIITTTLLPKDGVVYLCKDQNLRDITITLIGNDRMFLYDEKKRFLINFTHFGPDDTGISTLAHAGD